MTNLTHAAKDARDMVSALQAQQGKLFGRVRALTLTDQLATRRNIEAGLDWLRQQVQPADYLIVSVSGHGDIAH